MASITKLETGETSVELKRTRFRSSNARAKPEVVDRHARATLLAFRAFDDRAQAMAYLNEHQESLGGRALDVAGASDEGFAAVAADLAARAGT